MIINNEILIFNTILIKIECVLLYTVILLKLKNKNKIN